MFCVKKKQTKIRLDRSKPDTYVSLEIESNENGLSKGEVEILKSVTGLNDDTIHQWFENFKNENPNGLTPIAFRKLYQKYFSGRFSMHFCDHIFRTMDTDKDGFINLQEFLFTLALTSDPPSKGSDAKFEWIFSLYDVNGDGSIDIEEVTKIVRSIYMLGKDVVTTSEFKNPGSRAENLFQRMDLNSDGEVTKEEFLKFCRKDEDMAKLFDQKGEGGHALFFGL